MLDIPKPRQDTPGQQQEIHSSRRFQRLFLKPGPESVTAAVLQDASRAAFGSASLCALRDLRWPPFQARPRGRAHGLLILALLVPLSAGAAAQALSPSPPGPITNAEVFGMLKAGLPEDVIVAAIQARPSQFDTSPDALIAFKNAGATEAVLRAVMAAATATAPAPVPEVVSPPQPFVLLLRGEEEKPLHASQADIAQMKGSLGNDFASIVTSAAVETATIEVGARVLGSAVASGMGMTGLNMITSAMAIVPMLFQKAPTFTLLLALPGAESQTKIEGNALRMELRYDALTGVDPDAHEPLLLKLAPTKSNLRIVRAQKLTLKGGNFQAKDKVLQESLPAAITKLARGHVILEATRLQPGEYGIIRRGTAPKEALTFPQSGLQQTAYDTGSMVWDFSMGLAVDTEPAEAPNETVAQSEGGPEQ